VLRVRHGVDATEVYPDMTKGKMYDTSHVTKANELKTPKTNYNISIYTDSKNGPSWTMANFMVGE